MALFFSPLGQAKGIDYDANGLTITLSEEVESAVHNGVDLTFVCEFAVVKEFLFFTWAEQLSSHRFVVKHHALSNSYLVTEASSPSPQIFRSTTETMAHVAARALVLFEQYQVHGKAHKMRLRLSKYELPAPMRLSAFITEDWDLNSGWNTWQFAQ